MMAKSSVVLEVNELYWLNRVSCDTRMEFLLSSTAANVHLRERFLKDEAFIHTKSQSSNIDSTFSKNFFKKNSFFFFFFS